MNMRLYVGNLPFSTAEEGLQNIFAEYGKVKSVTVMKDRDTQRSRGFGFVEFESGDVEGAKHNINGFELDGRILKVNDARQRRSPAFLHQLPA
ncbi:MAG: RNA-binding protein [Chitinivibrionales bacterium]|nr:RNA-binding protein [Chitinivibrionales bacterium]